MSWCNKVSELYLTRSRLLDLTDWLSVKILVNISNDDGDGNVNGKKTIGLDWQNNNLARASCFFVYFFAVATQLQRASA